MIYLPGSVDPCQMAEMRIRGYSNDFGVQSFEFGNAITECNDLGGTHERAEIQTHYITKIHQTSVPDVLTNPKDRKTKQGIFPHNPSN